MHAYWNALSARQLDALARQDPVAVLVTGATEQHGAHLPLGTDTLIGEGLCRAMLERLDSTLDVLVLPTLEVGCSDEHLNVPGTLSLPADLARASIEAYGEGLARAGIRRLVVINSHGGNKAVLDMASLNLRRAHAMLVVKATYTRLPALTDGPSADELRRGIHGGELETALLLHLAPSLVKMGLAMDTLESEPLPPLIGVDAPAATAWLAEDLGPSGIAGTPTRASAAAGKRLAEHYAELLARVVTETASASLPPRPGA